MMGCLKETKLLQYLDGELPAERETHVAEHLKVCRSCTDRYALLQNRVRQVRKKIDLVYPKGEYSRPFSIPDECPETPGFGRVLTDWVKNSIRIPVPVLGAFSLILVILAAGFFWQQRQINQLRTDLAETKRGAMLYRVVNNDVEPLLLKTDLSEFKPIRNPRIYVEREGESEL